jgi:hypothetical protein
MTAAAIWAAWAPKVPAGRPHSQLEGRHEFRCGPQPATSWDVCDLVGRDRRRPACAAHRWRPGGNRVPEPFQRRSVHSSKSTVADFRFAPSPFGSRSTGSSQARSPSSSRATAWPETLGTPASLRARARSPVRGSLTHTACDPAGASRSPRNTAPRDPWVGPKPVPIRGRALSAWSRTWSGPRRRETSGSPRGSG